MKIFSLRSVKIHPIGWKYFVKKCEKSSNWMKLFTCGTVSRQAPITAREREERGQARGSGGDGELASEHDARILWFVGVRERNSDRYDYVGLVQKSIHNCVHFI